MEERKKNIVLSKSISFSLSVIQFCEKLEQERKYIISKQLLKSGTSIGANIHEAQNAESAADFIHKMKIAAKELEETKYWLTLCELSKSYPFEESLKTQASELGLIIYKILSTAAKRKKKNNINV